MSDTLPTVWPADPHTLAKHAILGGYLQAWMPILSRQLKGSDRILFVDGFAGPGVYEKGEDGSPILALKTALSQAEAEQFATPVHLLFIEKDPERFEQLKKSLATLTSRVDANPKVVLLEPQLGDCETILTNELAQHSASGRRFGPALVFLDQFGYSAVSMDMVSRILAFPMCEIFAYLQWRDLNRFMSDPTKWPGIDRAFGGEEWKPAIKMKGKPREKFLLDTYRNQLINRGAAKYVWNFAMCGDGGELHYWLFFATGNLRGLEEMKKAMWKVDESGGFRFSDGDDPNQLSLIHDATQEWLANHLGRLLVGKTLPVTEIQTFVLTQTPCYLFNDALSLLETQHRLKPVDAPAARRKGSFKKYPDMKVTFLDVAPKPPAPEQGTLF